ncbi:hypothetical protein KAR91_24645 [Candidatus Pacearchaeota archaeon]|nr:hypothetical protein [Candidatus Pacearchaeota archaeon]
MARNNPKPNEKPDWVPDDTSNIVVPGAGRKTSGWLFEVKPPAENFNWFWNLISRFTDYFAAQAEDWIVIDSDADEGDYATLAAYLADAPAAGDRILVKEDQTITVQTVIPSDISLKFLDGSDLLCATNIATSILQFGSNIVIEGVLNLVLSQTGTTDKAIEFNGDNVIGTINIENASTGTLTTAHHINANKTGNRVSGFAQNTGGGTLTNIIIDNSTEDSNLLIVVDETDNSIKTNGKGFVDLLNPQIVAGVKTYINNPIISNAQPIQTLIETDATSDNKRWDLTAQNEQLRLRAINDANDTAVNIFAVDRTGTAVDLFNILSTNLQHNGKTVFTEVGSDADGDIYYRDAGILKRLAKGANDTYLRLVGGLPVWSNIGIFSGGIQTDGSNTLKTKVIDIGDWNMDSTSQKNVAHGLTLANIRTIEGVIRSDSAVTLSPITPGFEDLEVFECMIRQLDATNVTLERKTAGNFDNNIYDATSYNRGWITITYVA